MSNNTNKLTLITDGKNLRDNIILASDAYKETHWKLYPQNTETVYSYLESRGGEFPTTMFYGLQIYLKKYLEGNVLDYEMIEEASRFCQKVFSDNHFNLTGWIDLLNAHGGQLPVRIKAVPEGTLVPTHNVLMTIENTDEHFPWLTNFLETLLFESVWYGTTVATQDYHIKQCIDKYAQMTGERVNPFHLNDFGFRGVSSKESAGIGGSAHLVNFMGTDTLEGIRYAMHYYGADVCGYSVVASEHSVVCMYGKMQEVDAYRRFIQQTPNGILSSVSDTYDFKYTVHEIYGKQLHDEILNRNGKFVVRPDSGDPSKMALWTLQSLWENFGGTVNEKGYKVLNPKVGVIYGDGINGDSIDKILMTITNAKFAVSNIIFGEGGAMLQKVDRDTCKFAIKASYGKVGGLPRDIYKETLADPSKASKRGRLKLIQNAGAKFPVTVGEGENGKDLLQTVFENGKLINPTTFDEVRARANTYF